MAEEKPDKESQTEEPTFHKISKAVEKGNVPFSREVILLGSIAGYCLIIFFVLSYSVQEIVTTLRKYWSNTEEWHLNTAIDLKTLLQILLLKIMVALAPIFIILIVAGISSSILQNSPRMVLDRIIPKLSRISISNGFNRVFSKAGLVEFIKVLFKFVGVSILVYFTLFHNHSIFMKAFLYNQSQIPEYIKNNVSSLLITILLALTVIAAFDIVWTRFKWWGDLRMTRQELKEEFKELEGDPILRSKMRSLARSRMHTAMLKNVPDASVVIVNPTHFSVALRYKPPKDEAPLVVAKGQDLIALKIREIAQEHNIEIVENVELAQSLFKKVEVNQTIPEEFYYAVAEVIKYINRHSHNYRT